MKEDIILKYLGGDLDEKGAESLLQWINSSESNRQYFARIKNEWTTSVLGNDASEIDLNEEFSLFNEKISRIESLKTINQDEEVDENIRKSVFWIRSLAAAVIALLIYGIFMTYRFLPGNAKVEYNEISTLRGQKTQITLADGSQIWLNSETSLKYPTSLNSKKVIVYLDGEAYFKVAKVRKRTFVVNTSTIDISVLGTSFNVKSYKGDKTVETTLEEGRISITGTAGNKKIKDPVILNPNQQATLIKESDEIVVNDQNQANMKETPDLRKEAMDAESSGLNVREKVNADIYTSWKDGKFIFRSENFESLSKRMERWYDIEIIIQDEDLKDKRYTGVFEKETVEQALRALSLSYPFSYKIDRNQVTITKKRS